MPASYKNLDGRVQFSCVFTLQQYSSKLPEYKSSEFGGMRTFDPNEVIEEIERGKKHVRTSIIQ